jgi:GNAT superfamily N-acetyltransferase
MTWRTGSRYGASRRAIARIGIVSGRRTWRSTRRHGRAISFDLTFARYIDPRRDRHAGLDRACERGAVGLVHVIVHAHGWQAEPVTYLQDLYADPDMRGTGVGAR